MTDYIGDPDDDILVGGNDNDTFTGGGGNDTLTGGGGNDIAIYSGNLADYSFNYDNGFIVQDTNPGDGHDGTDTLSGIEFLKFADADISLINLRHEFRVNTTTEGEQQTPALTALEDGGYLVTWISRFQDGSDYGIYAQRYDASGSPVDNEFRVNTTTADNQQSPDVIALGDGGFLVTWQSNNQDGVGYSIYAQRYDANGIAVNSEFRVNTTAADEQEVAKITALNDGGFVVTWQSNNQDGSGYGIYAQRYDANGIAVNSEFRVNTTTTNHQSNSAIAALADGGFVVTWQSNKQDVSNTAFNNRGVYAQRYDANGIAVGGEFLVNTATVNDQSDPAIAALADGGFVVAWHSNHEDGVNRDIYAQRYDVNGTAVDGEFRVNTYKAYFQSNPTISALADGGFIVAWPSQYQDGSDYGIYAQRFDSTGAAVNGEIRINTNTMDYQTTPAITNLSDGGFLVTWMSRNQDGSQFGIYAQRFDANGNPLGLKLTGDITNNTLTWDGSENVVIDGGLGNDTLKGGAGDDIYIVDSADDLVIENNSAGTDTIQSSVTYALPSHVENLTLTGANNINGSGNELNNIIIGNRGDNTLGGGAGNDTLIGGAGNDTLVGNAGDDIYIVDSADDIIIEDSAAGIDTVQSSGITYTLPANVEHLILIGANDINATGNELDNTLTGNSGDNTLNGGAGIDTLAGGAGNDTYIVDNESDVITEDINTGTDTVLSSVNFTLPSNIEKLTLIGSDNISGTGNALNNLLMGNSGNNTLNGNSGNDTLIGGGGNDILVGGTGNDLYVVDDTGVFIDENSNEGTDTVQTTVTYSLVSNVENLTLSGTDNINGTGNAFHNVLTGNSGDNVLHGGVGNDTLIGGAGNDIASYSGNSTGYTFGYNGVFIIRDNPDHWDNTDYDTNTGTDTLIGIEELQFADGNIRLVTQSPYGFRVNTYSDGSQTYSGIAALTDGGFVVTWNSSDQDGSGQGVYAQRYDVTGAAMGEFQINSNTNLNQDSPDIAVLSDGGFIVTWTSRHQVNNDSNGDIFAQRYAADGAMAGDEFLVNSYTDFNQVGSTVTALPGGGFVVVWMSDSHQDGGSYGIFAQQFDSLGAKVNGEFRVNTYTSGDQILPNIATLADGGFLVTWESSNGQDGSRAGIYAQRYSADGTTVGDEFRVNTSTASDQLNPAITSLPDGGFVITWEAIKITGDDNFDIYAQRYDANSEAVGSEFRVNNHTENVQKNSAITSLYDGGFVVTWQSNNQDGSGYGIYAQRYDASGNSVGSEFLINTYTSGDQTLPNIAALADGGFVVTWQSNQGTSNGSYEIYAQRYDANGDPVHIEIAGDDNNNVITWNDNENIILKGSGGNDIIAGGSGKDTLFGGEGNDILNGGYDEDFLYGDAGDDTYIMDSTEDVIIENTEEGTDTVRSSVNYSLPSNTEILALIGVSNINGTGNELDNILTGNSGNNFLNGGDGNDHLNGGIGNDILDGGTGADTMIGGVGNDTYYIDNLLDIYIESPFHGTDTIITIFDHALTPEFENLTLLDGDAIIATGTAVDNLITGNSNNNLLTGWAGQDTLEGEAGNDVLLGGRGKDLLYGEAGNDYLDGGQDVDILFGGAGDDTFVITRGDGAGLATANFEEDQIVETFNGGTDTVESHVYTYTLPDNIEYLTLSGTHAIKGFGNSLNNHLTGNAHNNLLDGGVGNDVLWGLEGNDTLSGGIGNDILNGGEGTDILWGGSGADIFVFDNISSQDWIFDFSRTSGDVIHLSLNVFSGTGAVGNSMDNNAFLSGNDIQPLDADDHILYDTATGALYYDSDGSGPTDMIQFATLAGAPNLLGSDIHLIA